MHIFQCIFSVCNIRKHKRLFVTLIGFWMMKEAGLGVGPSHESQKTLIVNYEEQKVVRSTDFNEIEKKFAVIESQLFCLASKTSK